MASAEALPRGLWFRAAELPRTRVSTSDRLSDVLASCDAPRALCFAPESEDALFSDAGEAGALAEGWARSCGAVSTPLHFCEQNVLAVNLGPGGGLRAALLPPEDLPFLAVHHGGAALRAHRIRGVDFFTLTSRLITSLRPATVRAKLALLGNVFPVVKSSGSELRSFSNVDGFTGAKRFSYS